MGPDGEPPDVAWTPYVWTVLVLVAAIVYVAFRMRTHRSKRVLWAGTLAGLTLATIGTIGLGYHAVNVPLDDPSFFLCNSPEPSPPSAVVADSIVPTCAAGKTITLSPGQTIAVVLTEEWNVDVGTRWTDLAVADPNVLRDVNAPISVSGPKNSQLSYEVGVYRAYQPGKTTLSAVEHWCNGNLQICDRGARWWVTVEVT